MSHAVGCECRACEYANGYEDGLDDLDADLFADRWRYAWAVVGEAVNGDAALDEAVALAERFQDRLAEARALLERVEKYVIEDKAATPGATRLARVHNEIRAWLREGKE